MAILPGDESHETDDTMTIGVRAILPRRFNPSVFRKAFSNTADQFGKETQQQFNKTTATWDGKPTFTIEKAVSTGRIIVIVATNNEIYGFVNNGTKPHIILPGILTGKSDKKALAFASQFSPKSTPGIIGSNPGFVGPVDTVRAGVSHPGTTGIFFNRLIKEDWERGSKLVRIADAEIAQANRRAWSG
jgi:hypothetical protein